ncbi:MAG: hypothetical protein KA419_17450 [Acidobacteria bacterium]|nr:hypothetical protein [Acidobacteriota bacterium]
MTPSRTAPGRWKLDIRPEYPEWLERWWLETLTRRLGKPSVSATLLALESSIAQLGDVFTTGRVPGFRGYAGRNDLLAAYGVFHFPRTYLAVLHVLNELLGPGGWSPPARLRCTDLGCGLGAASAALATRLERHNGFESLAIDGIDPALESLDLYGALFTENADRWPRTTARYAGGDMRRPGAVPAGTDLVLAAFSLNEAFHDATDTELLRWVTRTMDRLSADGVLVLVEPALQETSARLMRLRDALASGTAARVVAPCPHAHPCPLPAHGRRWCHDVRNWKPSEAVKLANRHLFRSVSEIKFCFLALARPNGPEGLPAPGSLRLVTPIMPSHGRFQFSGCDPAGRLVHCDILERTLNRELELLLKNLEKGDWIVVDPPPPATGAHKVHRVAKLDRLTGPFRNRG